VNAPSSDGPTGGVLGATSPTGAAAAPTASAPGTSAPATAAPVPVPVQTPTERAAGPLGQESMSSPLGREAAAGTLPFTGAGLSVIVLAGAALLLLGLALRARAPSVA
jgi:hypothetical protein